MIWWEYPFVYIGTVAVLAGVRRLHWSVYVRMKNERLKSWLIRDRRWLNLSGDRGIYETARRRSAEEAATGRTETASEDMGKVIPYRRRSGREG
jgi:hypothetical protein